MADAILNFPADFLWGTATSSHQVEGGNSNNDWWAWEHAPHAGETTTQRIFRNQISDRACEWWDGRAEEDIQRMKALNTNAHRMSLEWSRIEPEPGKWNHDALDRYREILKAMRAAGITPMVTLHHFTNPIWLAEKGSWLNEDVIEHFRRYVQKAVSDLSDLCETWCTINEPDVFASQGWFMGKWPPGRGSATEYFKVSYNLLMAHAAAYEVIHDLQPQGHVGFAKHMVAFFARRQRHFIDRFFRNQLDKAFNALLLDAISTGVYRPLLGKRIDVPKARNTLDWIGLNYYTRNDAYFNPRKIMQLFVDYGPRPDQQKGPEGWGEIYPDGLFMQIGRLYKQFHKPIYITENGIPDEYDQSRPAFLLRHLQRVWKAVNFNWPVKGYFFWSLLDNFEWAEGYDPRFRFGLYNVNFETQARTLTRSGELYAEIAKTGSISSDMARRFAPEVVNDLFPGSGPEDMYKIT